MAEKKSSDKNKKGIKKEEAEKKPEEGKKETSKKETKEIKKTEPSKQESQSGSEKQENKEQKKVKKTEAIVNAFNVPISTKHSVAVCRFIKNKTIEDAITDLELVIKNKKSVPMRGEIPHRKGPGKAASGSGRYPRKAAEQFIVLLKSLSANASFNGLENPVISEAVANIGSRPYGRHGIRRKRTHIKIIAREKIVKQ